MPYISLSLSVFIRCGGQERPSSVRYLEEAGRVTTIPSLAMAPLGGGEETHGGPALEHTNNGVRPCHECKIYCFTLSLLSHSIDSHEQQDI